MQLGNAVVSTCMRISKAAMGAVFIMVRPPSFCAQQLQFPKSNILKCLSAPFYVVCEFVYYDSCSDTLQDYLRVQYGRFVCPVVLAYLILK